MNYCSAILSVGTHRFLYFCHILAIPPNKQATQKQDRHLQYAFSENIIFTFYCFISLHFLSKDCFEYIHYIILDWLCSIYVHGSCGFFECFISICSLYERKLIITHCVHDFFDNTFSSAFLVAFRAGKEFCQLTFRAMGRGQR